VALFYATGMSVSMPIHDILLFGVFNFIGLMIVVLLYALYYKYIVKKVDLQTEWLPTIHNIKLAIRGVNIRVYRYCVILYISAMLAYYISIIIHNTFYSFVDISHTYWGGYFIFMMIQFTGNIKNLYKRITYRFLGTFCGLALATVIVYLVRDNLFLIRMAFFISAVVLLHVSFKPKTYFHFQFAVNCYLLLTYIGLLGNSWVVAKYRFDETNIAAIVAFGSVIIIYPIIKKIMPLEKWEKKST